MLIRLERVRDDPIFIISFVDIKDLNIRTYSVIS